MKQQELLAGATGEQRGERDRGRGEALGRARVRSAERHQTEYRISAVDDLLPAAHRARAVWRFVEQLDLRGFETKIRAREGRAGRPALDPKIGLAVWLYATSQGVGSARQVAELCVHHQAYRWLCGGVAVNYHTLSDFRTQHRAEFDQLLTQSLAVLLHQQLLQLRRVVQDGTKVAAPVSRSATHRRPTLEECLRQARAQLAAVRAARAEAQTSAQRRRQAAQERAAREREARLVAALEELQALEGERAAYKRGAKEPTGEPRAARSDPTARKMRMGDGGYRMGYNVHLASTPEGPHVVVGVAVTQARTDFGAAAPMIDAVTARTGITPAEWVVDAGFTTRAQVDAVAAQGVTLYGPLPERAGKPDPYAPQSHDSPAMRALKARMPTEAGRQVYAQRAPAAELVHADLKRWRTLNRLTVRGLQKITSVVLLNVLTFNMLRMIRVLDL